MEITQELVKELFDYNDGCLYWKKLKVKNQKKVGDIAGWVNQDNYHYIEIFGRCYKRSRVVYLYHNGWLPEVVDHEDRNRSNDRIENLRPATESQNARNRTSARNSSSKYLGVQIYNKATKSRPPLWLALIKRNREVPQIKLGVFKSEEQAALEYNKFAVYFHKEFANLNIIDKTFEYHPKTVYNVTIKSLDSVFVAV